MKSRYVVTNVRQKFLSINIKANKLPCFTCYPDYFLLQPHIRCVSIQMFTLHIMGLGTFHLPSLQGVTKSTPFLNLFGLQH